MVYKRSGLTDPPSIDVTMYVEDYIKHLSNPKQKELVREMHGFLTTYPLLTSKIRFKIPFYYGITWVCYLNPIHPLSVELVFLRGKELKNKSELLDARGRKMVKGIILTNIEALPFETIDEILQEAILLDQKVPFTVKRKK